MEKKVSLRNSFKNPKRFLPDFLTEKQMEKSQNEIHGR